MRVTRLALAPVKGLRLLARRQIALGPQGVREDRRFHLIDARGRMVNAKHMGRLCAVVADYDDEARRLELTFPDGGRVQATVHHGEEVETRFYSRPRKATVVVGPWADAVSEFVGQPLRLVETSTSSVDRGVRGAVSLISRASVERLSQVAAQPTVDGRRFRMLIEIDGCRAHEEDGWVGARATIGGAIVGVRGHVGRCAVTTLNPHSGTTDLPTLDLLGRYRGDAGTTEPLAFGIYGDVIQAGTVRIGDEVAVHHGSERGGTT